MAFIAFEGSEGCGKTTQVKKLAHWLTARGIANLSTREPGGTPLAENIRALFKAVPAHGDEPLPATELMLVMAARAQHVRKVIAPALARNEVVLCDRFLDSSYVYQWLLGGLDKSWVDAVARGVLLDVKPALTIVLTLSAQAARARLAIRQSRTAGDAAEDRLDAASNETFVRLDAGFRKLVQERVPYPDGSVPVRHLIDASGSENEVFQRVLHIVSQTLAVSVS